MRRWMSLGGNTVEPGHVYAMLLAAGKNRGGSPANNTIGAGSLSLPTNASLFWGKVAISQQQTVNIPINVGAGSLVDVALWWSLPLNNVDLQLFRPNSQWCAQSLTPSGQWEKTYCFSASTGSWTVRVQANVLSFPPQTVYWAAIRR